MSSGNFVNNSQEESRIKTINLAIFISGTGSNMVALINSIRTSIHSYNPVIVISNRADASGNRKAKDLNVPLLVVDEANQNSSGLDFENQVREVLRRYEIKLICLAGFMRILSADFINQFDGTIINIHPSILPSLKGTKTHTKAIRKKIAFHGATVHIVTPKLDSGKILGQISMPVFPNDTDNSLANRLKPYEHKLYCTVIKRMSLSQRLPIQLRA